MEWDSCGSICGTPHTRRYEEIVTKLGPFLRGCGYNPKKDLEFLPISGLHGTNIKDPVPKEVRTTLGFV